MALRTKTIEYAFPLSTATVASAAARDFTAITINIPESSPIFRSVTLENTVYGFGGTQSVTAVLQGISLGAIARNDVTVTQTITSSGEDLSHIFLRDVTSYFTTNWTGTSMSSGCRLTVTGPATINATAKLIITYQYEDSSSTTRIKTVKIPIDGNTGGLTTSLTAVGGITDQIPALDTFLPENSKVYRDIFFETYVHTGNTSNIDYALNMRFNGTTTISATYEGGATSDYPIKRIDKLLGSINTANSYSVEASTSNIAMPFTCLCGILYVTYEYNHSTSTSIMNSIQLPAFDNSGWIAGIDDQDWALSSKKLLVSEPGYDFYTDPFNNTLSLKQSGLLVSFIDSGAVNFNIKVGTQIAVRTFSHTATVRAGAVYQSIRIDEMAVNGGYDYIRSGFNTIETFYYTDSSTFGSIGSNVSGIFFLNYVSEKHVEGDGVHSHTTYWLNRPWAAWAPSYRLQYTPTTTPNIPESDYYIISNCYNIILQTTGTQASTLYYSFNAEYDNFGQGGGWAEVYSANYNTDAEIGPLITWVDGSNKFIKYPSELNNTYYPKISIEDTRDFKFDINPNVTFFQVVQMVTYSSKVFEYSGSWANATVSPVRIKAFANLSPTFYPQNFIQIYDFESSLLPGSFETGTFSIPWYVVDNTGYLTVVIYIENGDGSVVRTYSSFPSTSINFDLSDATYYSYQ